MLNITNIKDLGYLSDEELRLIIFLSYMDYFKEDNPLPLDKRMYNLLDNTFNYIRYGNSEGKKEPKSTQNQKPFNLLSLLFWNH
ncbi:hypothetical protein CMT52_17880 [Elizabethkingia anophelis]|nr:hypothetical protein [Elizabethkingia anophelis]